MKGKMHIIVLSAILISFLLISPITLSNFNTSQFISNDDSAELSSEYVPRNIRVAVYTETNTTVPTYAAGGGALKNNATGIRDILVSYGYDVTLLDVQDISNYELTTANYDVFVLPDNVPRENITYHVMEYWLGGGGLLTFDTSIVFLCSFGIIPPEGLGTTGSGTYWTWSGNDVVIAERHPVSRSVSGTINTIGEFSNCWYFPWLQTSSIASDLTNVASSGVSSDWSMVLAYDPSDRGGKVVTIQIDLENDPSPEFYPLYADAVDWIAPRPKAHILYDLTHQPWCPTDTWDWAGDANYLTDWRNGLVAREYTVDKLHPSSMGNLTLANLASYDMLVTNQPLINFSASEVQAVEDWVQAGGGLFVVGDNPNVIDNHHLNYLINPYGIQFNHTPSPYNEVFSDFDIHPTTEDCTSLSYHGSTSLILTNGAYPIWRYADGYASVGVSEYGDGRVLVISDANSVLDSWIVENDNFQFAMNVANWLTSDDAEVLLFHNTGLVGYNHYRSEVANALNELGLNFMLTYMPLYFNLSLNSRTWDLIVYDANQLSAATDEEFIQDHLENGGKLIMRDYAFRFDTVPLWHYIGFRGCGDDARITDGAPTIYMWNEFHNIFNRPVDFTLDYFDSTSNDFVTDWTNVTVLNNATALAGITPTIETNQSAILLGAGGQALCNMFALSEYNEDIDDTTYPDSFELWLNEIAYMMRPTIDSPGDIVIDLYTDTPEFTWVPHSYAPGDYQIKRDSVIIQTQWWYGDPITVDVSGLAVGEYEFELTVRDHVAYRADDTITVTIEDSTPTTTTDSGTTDTVTTSDTPSTGDLTMMLILGGGIVLIVIIIFIIRKK